MNTSVLVQPSGRMTSKAWEKPRLSAARAIAAPAYPPIRAWEEEVGRPHHQVSTSHTMAPRSRSEEHTSELQSRENLVCRLLLEKKNHVTTALIPIPIPQYTVQL